MENGRLDRIEAALLQLTQATEAGFSGTTEMLWTLHGRMTNFEGRMANFEGRMANFDGRMANFERQMTEALGRLRIIGERLATHTHEEAD